MNNCRFALWLLTKGIVAAYLLYLISDIPTGMNDAMEIFWRECDENFKIGPKCDMDKSGSIIKKPA